jgi:hypothetical protein
MSKMSTRSTAGGQYEDVYEGIKAYEIGRARVYLEGKVLAIAAHSDSDRVNAGARCVSTMMQGKETANKESYYDVRRKLAQLAITSSSKE